MGLLLLFLVALFLLLLIGAGATVYHLRHPPRKTIGVVLARGRPADPADLDLPAEAVTFALPDGTATPGWVIRGRQPDAPLVVIVHGYADSRLGALTWAPLLVPFASSVVVFDLSAHGDAEAEVCHLGALEAADVLAVLDELDTTRGVVLFGYSMGAGIALAAAATGDPRIVGVIADGPYRRWHEPVRAVFRRRRYPHHLVLPLAGVVLRLIEPTLGYDRAEDAKQVRVPVLVLHGECDDICAVDDGRAIAEAAPHGRLVTFPDGGHLDLAAVDPERYRAALAEFFAHVGAPA